MSPRTELHAAADDMAAYGSTLGQFPVALCTTSPAAIERAAEAFRDRALAANFENFDRAAARAEGLAHAINDADSASVLALLVDAGELDSERIDDLLMQAAERRINAALPTPRSERTQRLLAAVKALIEACDDSLDRSTLLQGAKARAHTEWVRAGGAL